jgi:hypothetical protein
MCPFNALFFHKLRNIWRDTVVPEGLEGKEALFLQAALHPQRCAILSSS